MYKRSIAYPLVALLVALAMLLVNVQPAAAFEPGDEAEITGTVISIDEEAGSFEVETEEGEIYIVFPDEEFDFSSIQEGDTVEVEGTVNEDGSISATSVIVQEQDDEGEADEGDTEEQEGPSEGYFCTQSEDQHPFGARLAERYGMDYETLQAWFCDGFGWGQILLALQTGLITGDDPGELLEARNSGLGWGEIWQGLNLIGRPEDAGPPDDVNGNGRPDWAGPPSDKGRPENPGKPEGKGRPEGAGPPPGRP
jgi:hypothetical protein